MTKFLSFIITENRKLWVCVSWFQSADHHLDISGSQTSITATSQSEAPCRRLGLLQLPPSPPDSAAAPPSPPANVHLLYLHLLLHLSLFGFMLLFFCLHFLPFLLHLLFLLFLFSFYPYIYLPNHLLLSILFHLPSVFLLLLLLLLYLFLLHFIFF